MSTLELWSLWWCWPMRCTETSECDCEQHQADDDEATAIWTWECAAR